MKNPIDIDEASAFIISNPGTCNQILANRFKCDITKVRRALSKLRKLGRLFDQDIGNTRKYFDPAYAEEHKVPKRIYSRVPQEEYNARNRAKRAKDKIKVALTSLEQILHFDKLMPVMRSAR